MCLNAWLDGQQIDKLMTTGKIFIFLWTHFTIQMDESNFQKP